jgi:hypothetical protein
VVVDAGPAASGCGDDGRVKVGRAGGADRDGYGSLHVVVLTATDELVGWADADRHARDDTACPGE